MKKLYAFSLIFVLLVSGCISGENVIISGGKGEEKAGFGAFSANLEVLPKKV